MKKLISVGLVVFSLMGLSNLAFAAEKDKLLKAQGGIHKITTADKAKLILGSGSNVLGVLVNAGSTASVVSLYDGSSSSTTAITAGKIEIAAAANTQQFLDLRTAPIRFKNGIVAVTDQNENGLVIYTEEAL